MPGPSPPDRWTAGDELEADRLNAIAEALERAAKVRASAGFEQAGGGLRLGRDDSFLAVLSGSASPYSFAEAAPDGTPSVAGRSGDDAYAINGEAGLAGKVVRLHPTAWDHRFVVPKIKTPCSGTVCIRIYDQADGSPVVGARVVVTYGGGSVAVDADTDADGEACTGEFPLASPYAIAVTVPNFTGIDAQFSTLHGPGRACGAVIEYDFCASKICLTLSDCGNGGDTTDFDRSGSTGNPRSISLQRAQACSLGSGGDSYFEGLRGFPATYPSGFLKPSPSTYCDVFFSLRRRPWTCGPATWKWRATTGLSVDCDNDGEFKDSCGTAPSTCGESASESVPMYGLGPDWTYPGRSGAAGPYGPAGCGVDCLPGVTDLNTDCSPSGLVNRTLFLTFAGNDDGNTIGDLVGVPIELTCQGYDPSPPPTPLGIHLGPALHYSSGSLGNQAGMYQCCEFNPFFGSYVNCETLNFSGTTVDAWVYPSFIRVIWTNGDGTTHCPEGKVYKPGSKSGESFDNAHAFGNGGQVCHPTSYNVCYQPAPGFPTNCGEITE